MRKIIYALFFMSLFSNVAIAQNDDLQKEMEQMTQQMEQMLQQLDLGTMMMDTMMMQQINPNQLFQPLQSEEMSQVFEQLFGMMNQQMQGLSEEDIQSFEDLLGGFGLQVEPLIPAPDQLEEGKSKEKQPTKPAAKKKKRKTYSM